MCDVLEQWHENHKNLSFLFECSFLVKTVALFLLLLHILVKILNINKVVLNMVEYGYKEYWLWKKNNIL